MSTASRFRELRKLAGLSLEEVGAATGIGTSNVWDIESHDDELSTCYSPSDLRNFAIILGVHPIEFFGGGIVRPPLPAPELARLIHEQCRLREVTLELFEVAVGWRLRDCIEPPDLLLSDLSIDGIQWLCRELGVNWLRVISSL